MRVFDSPQDFKLKIKTMNKLFKILIWTKNLILNILVLPGYIILILSLLYIFIIEMGKSKQMFDVIKAITTVIKSKK